MSARSELLEDRLVLALHERAHDVLGHRTVVRMLLGSEDRPLVVEVSEQVRIGRPGILVLHVEDTTPVLDVVVVAEQGAPSRLGHRSEYIAPLQTVLNSAEGAEAWSA